MTYQPPYSPPGGPPPPGWSDPAGSPFGPPDNRARAVAELKNKATIWLVVAIAGIWFGLSFITGPLAWIFGAKIRGEYRALGVEPDGMATGAWIVGIVTTLLWLAVFAFVMILVFALGGLAFLAA